MTKWFDTHGHLNDERYDDDRQFLLEELPALGIGHMVVAGYDEEPMRDALEVAKLAPWLYAAEGVHPENADQWNDRIEAALREKLKHEKTVALGEIGLDYHWGDPPREVQREVFARQMEIAKEVGLPVVIHMRDATQDTLEIIRKAGEIPGGVMHCFSGSIETAKELLDRGWYISFSGTITFKNAERLRQVVEFVPVERMFVETDCPYLAPVPMRGKRNQPDYVKYTGMEAARIKGMDAEDFAAITMENAKRFFHID